LLSLSYALPRKVKAVHIPITRLDSDQRPSHSQSVMNAERTVVEITIETLLTSGQEDPLRIITQLLSSDRRLESGQNFGHLVSCELERVAGEKKGRVQRLLSKHLIEDITGGNSVHFVLAAMCLQGEDLLLVLDHCEEHLGYIIGKFYQVMERRLKSILDSRTEGFLTRLIAKLDDLVSQGRIRAPKLIMKVLWDVYFITTPEIVHEALERHKGI